MTTNEIREGVPLTLLRFMLQDHAGTLLHEERVAWCLKRIQELKETVEIYKVQGGRRAAYKNLMVCGSIWHCPVCSARITEVRRLELSKGIAAWKGSMVMVTYTLRHNRFQPLTKILDGLKASYRRLKSGRQFQAVKERFHVTGSVRTLEVTVGRNGWHVHIHELIFVDHAEYLDSKLDDFRRALFNLWANSLKKEKMDADEVHGVDVRTAKSAVADYVAKFGKQPIDTNWDVSHELTKQPVKRAKEGGFTPMQLLHESYKGDLWARARWIEYAHGFKGSNQLVWSRGMRDLLGLGVELNDAEIAESLPEEFSPFVTISRHDWIAVRGSGQRGALLEYSANHTEEETVVKIGEISRDWWEE